MVSKARIGRPPTCECGACQKCKRKEYMRRWYQSKTPEQRRAMLAQRNPEAVRRNDAKRFQRHKVTRMAAARRWKDEHPESALETQNRWDQSNPEKKRAHAAVAAAVKRGALSRPSCCEQCGLGSPRIEGHHPDYSKPLEVVWLCLDCHGKTRRKYAEVR